MNCTDGVVSGVVGIVVDVAVEHQVGDVVDVDRRLHLERRVRRRRCTIWYGAVLTEVSICRVDAVERENAHSAVEEDPGRVVTAGVTADDRSKPLSSIDFTPETAMSWLNRIVAGRLLDVRTEITLPVT